MWHCRKGHAKVRGEYCEADDRHAAHAVLTRALSNEATSLAFGF